MTSIYDIPYEDIEIFLLANNKRHKNKNEAYNIVLTLLKDKKAVGHTTSIIEWMIAYNLLVKKVNVPNFTIYQIDNMKQFQVDELAKLLTLNGNNRDNIKNILRYLGKLDELIEHPDIKPQILNTILGLKILSFDLKDVINVFKDNKFLRKFIYDNMEQIISNNIIIKKYDKYLSKEEVSLLARFIFDLMRLNENILMKEAIKIARKHESFQTEYYQTSKVIRYLTFNVLESLEADLIIKYFDLFDYINYVYNEGRIWKDIITDHEIVNALLRPEGQLKESQQKFLPSIFKAALAQEKMRILSTIYHFWYFEFDPKIAKKSLFLEQMEPLVKEYEEKYPSLKYDDL